MKRTEQNYITKKYAYINHHKFFIILTILLLMLFSCSKNEQKYNSLNELNKTFLKANPNLKYLETKSNGEEHYNIYTSKDNPKLFKIVIITGKEDNYTIKKISNDFIVDNPVTYWIEENKYGLKCSYENKQTYCEEVN